MRIFCHNYMMRPKALLFAFAGVAALQAEANDLFALVPVYGDTCRLYQDCRRLTDGEIALARPIYGSAIQYEDVRVINGRYLGVFPIGDQYTGIAPDGNIHAVAAYVQSPDYSLEPHKQPFFLHELFHVKQHNEGLNLLGHAFHLHAMRSASPYAYVPEAGTTIDDYNFEQQASIAADAYMLGQNLRHSETLFAAWFTGQGTDEKCARFQLLSEILVTANVTVGAKPDLCR